MWEKADRGRRQYLKEEGNASTCRHRSATGPENPENGKNIKWEGKNWDGPGNAEDPTTGRCILPTGSENPEVPESKRGRSNGNTGKEGVASKYNIATGGSYLGNRRN